MSNAAKVAKAVVAGGLVLGGPAIIAHIAQLEGRDLVVRADALAYGVPTVCGGYTDWSLRVGQAYTKADCDRIDHDTAVKYGRGVLACVRVPLNQNQFDALTLFAINVGVAGACGSRAVQLVNAKQYAAGCRAISRGPNGEYVWSYSGGQFRQGLANRRAFETKLCVTPVEAA